MQKVNAPPEIIDIDMDSDDNDDADDDDESCIMTPPLANDSMCMGNDDVIISSPPVSVSQPGFKTQYDRLQTAHRMKSFVPSTDSKHYHFIYINYHFACAITTEHCNVMEHAK